MCATNGELYNYRREEEEKTAENMLGKNRRNVSARNISYIHKRISTREINRACTILSTERSDTRQKEKNKNVRYAHVFGGIFGLIAMTKIAWQFLEFRYINRLQIPQDPIRSCFVCYCHHFIE